MRLFFRHRERTARTPQKILGDHEQGKERDEREDQDRAHTNTPNVALHFFANFTAKSVGQWGQRDHGGQANAQALAIAANAPVLCPLPSSVRRRCHAGKFRQRRQVR